jgi:hypothetical protein
MWGLQPVARIGSSWSAQVGARPAPGAARPTPAPEPAAPAPTAPVVDLRDTALAPPSATAVSIAEQVAWERSLVGLRLRGDVPVSGRAPVTVWPTDVGAARDAVTLGLDRPFSQAEVDRRFRAIVARERPDLGGVDGQRVATLRAARDRLRGEVRAARWIGPDDLAPPR